MISLSGAVNVILTLIIAGIVFGLLDLLIRKAPFIPEEWKQGMRYVLLVLAVLVLIGILVGLTGGGGMGPIFRP
jgi:preprotein translocase subunit SecE